MKTRSFIKMLKSYGIEEVKTSSNTPHRKFQLVNGKLERPIMISRSAATKEVNNACLRETQKLLKGLKCKN